jgi:hypothetical protein
MKICKICKISINNRKNNAKYCIECANNLKYENENEMIRLYFDMRKGMPEAGIMEDGSMYLTEGMWLLPNGTIKHK